ncbi:MAG: hypothetical protein ACKN9T_04245, partial [Candidatus Methylumidiphilus sp.]
MGLIDLWHSSRASAGLATRGLEQPQEYFANQLNPPTKKDDFIPPRVSDEMLSRLEPEGKQDYGVDGTERRIIRPGGQ